MENIKYTWQELNDDVIWLGKAITASNFKPQEIVGIVRGGAIPAVMLSHMLDVPFTAIEWSKRDYGHRNFGQWMDIVKNACDGRRYLIVEDIVDSGETLHEMFRVAQEYFSIGLWGNKIQLSTLWFNTAQNKVKVNFMKNLIDRNLDQRWIVYPYELSNEVK